MFTELGLQYIGPFDGHDIGAVEAALRQACVLQSPVVVRCATVKGRGHLPAESDLVDRLHAVGVVDPVTGRSNSTSRLTWTGAFSDEMVAIADERLDVVGIADAMGLCPFADRYPVRVVDIDIAEQHAVTFVLDRAGVTVAPPAA